jgi:DNA mismatch repair protein MSH6
MPLRDIKLINDRYAVSLSCYPVVHLCCRLDAVEDLMAHDSFEKDFQEVVKGVPDLERIVSRIHAGTCKVKDFLKILEVGFVTSIYSSLISRIVIQEDQQWTSRTC